MSDAVIPVDEDVAAIIARCRTEGPLLYLPEQLEPKVYKRVNVILELAGGEWERKAKAHRFDIDAQDAIDGIVQFGEVTRAESDQYFPTPESLAIRMASLADIRQGMFVLEPSAGDGALAVEALGPKMRGNGAMVHAIELYERTYRRLVANLKARAPRERWEAVAGDFMDYEPNPVYDRVVMNPPFAKSQDVRHVMRAWEFLKPGGVLVAITGRGIRYRDSALYREFREWTSHYASTEDLPDGTFAEAGTQVRTCLIKARKPKG